MISIPRPQFVALVPGELTWHSPLKVRADEGLREVVEMFSEMVLSNIGWDLQWVDEGDDADIDLSLDATRGPESFALRVAQRAEVSVSDAAGAWYALQYLRNGCPPSTFRPHSSLAAWSVPCGNIVDSPRFAWRGVHLDVSRHFFSVSDVIRLMDLMSLHRLNHLHLHLNDDQGWRVEVPSWPRLTDIGSRRRSSPVGHESEGRDDGVAHEGFYSLSDIARLRVHAERRFITLVPEIDLPGHAQAALAAYPQFSNVSEPLEVWTRWGISENVLAASEEALEFAESVVCEVADLFPGSPFHIGGDECPTTQWETSEAAREEMKRRDMSDPRELQGLFTERLARALRERGHDVLAWDEVLDATVPEGTTIVAWRDEEKGVEAAQRGYDVVMAPMQWVYFDWLNSASPEEPVAIAPPPAVSSLRHVYDYSVVPEDKTEEMVGHVRGSQAQLWTEYIATRDHLDYMAFPRLCAFAEVVWGTAGSFEDFRRRLEIHVERLRALGVSFRPLDQET